MHIPCAKGRKHFGTNGDSWECWCYTVVLLAVRGFLSFVIVHRFTAESSEDVGIFLAPTCIHLLFHISYVAHSLS
ncbi:hypothetical protein C8R43DRAFT_974870 [Mycena crocata]|nr:hypothetical protein C8R43DRAFT_974870 [Mycena crocata]